jgi:hypothetical protein
LWQEGEGVLLGQSSCPAYVSVLVYVNGSWDWHSVSQTLVWAEVVAEIHDAARISVRVNDDRHEFAVVVE